MIVNGMVEVLENGKRLVIKLGDHVGFSSSFMEWISESIDANVKKIASKVDRYPNPIYVEYVYEIQPLSNHAEIKVTIRDDNDNNENYHYDYMYFKYNGKNWESEYKPNPFHH